jgi:hypothetical protein
MPKGMFLWFCGEYMLFVKVELDASHSTTSSDYHLELVRDELFLHVNGEAIGLSDDDVEVYKLKKGVKLSEVKGHEDYNNIALPIECLSGVPALLSAEFKLISAEFA